MQNKFELFTVTIARLNRLIRKIKTEEMSEFNLKTPHVSCLYYLYCAQSLTATELCGLCEEDKASVSRAIDYLEKRGYIYYLETSDKKRYRSPLSLTEQGKVVGKLVNEKVNMIVEVGGKTLDDDTRQAMYRGLSVISENLEAFCKKYGE